MGGVATGIASSPCAAKTQISSGPSRVPLGTTTAPRFTSQPCASMFALSWTGRVVVTVVSLRVASHWRMTASFPVGTALIRVWSELSGEPPVCVELRLGGSA